MAPYLPAVAQAGATARRAQLDSKTNGIVFGRRRMFFVYVIVSELKGLRFYVGLTTDIEQRKGTLFGRDKVNKRLPALEVVLL